MPKRPRSVLHEYVLPPDEMHRRSYNTSRSFRHCESTRSKPSVTPVPAEPLEGPSLLHHIDTIDERESEEISAAITDRDSPFTQSAAFASEGQGTSSLAFPCSRMKWDPRVCSDAEAEETTGTTDDVEPIFSHDERIGRLPPSCREACREPNWLERAVLRAQRKGCTNYMMRCGIVMGPPEPAQLCISQSKGENREVEARRAALMEIVAGFYTL